MSVDKKTQECTCEAGHKTNRYLNIARNTAQQRREKSPYYAEPKLSQKAQKEIADILMQEKKSRQDGTSARDRS